MPAPSPPAVERPLRCRLLGRIVSAWCLAGVSALFAFAILRLGGRGLAAVAGGLTALEWGVLIVCGGFFVYGEGVLALQRKWVPRLAERAKAVREESSGFLHLMAPLYGMSLIGAARGQLLRSWAMVAAILVAVRIVGVLPEPWRGIIDLSVAAALVWGLAAIASAAPSVLRS